MTQLMDVVSAIGCGFPSPLPCYLVRTNLSIAETRNLLTKGRDSTQEIVDVPTVVWAWFAINTGLTSTSP